MIKDKYDIIVSYLEGPTTRIVSGCNDNNTKIINVIGDIRDYEHLLKNTKNIDIVFHTAALKRPSEHKIVQNGCIRRG